MLRNSPPLEEVTDSTDYAQNTEGEMSQPRLPGPIDEPRPPCGAAGAVRAASESAVPSQRDCDVVVPMSSSLQLVGNESVFERGLHVPVAHINFFNPPPHAPIFQLKSRDRRLAIEWEYINAAVV